MFGYFLEKPRGLLPHVAVTGSETHIRKGEIKFVACAGDCDIKKASLFLDVFEFIEGTFAGKHAVGKPDDEYGAVFQSLGLMNGGESDFFIVVGGLDSGLGIGSAEEGKLREKFGGIVVSFGEISQGIKIFATGFVVGKLFFEIIVIDRFDDRIDHHSRGAGNAAGGDFFEGMSELEKGFTGFGGDGTFFQGIEKATVRSGFGEVLPDGVGTAGADAGEKFDDAFEGNFVAGIDDEFKEGADVFDVGLLEETESAGDLKGDAAPGEFELHLHGMIVSPVKDGDVVEWNAFLTEFEHALGDEGGLVIIVSERDDGGFDP